MPTARPRHSVTETPEVAAALDAAATVWPEATRAQLLLRLVDAGRRALGDAAAARAARRTAELARARGGLRGTYADGERMALRDEWPA